MKLSVVIPCYNEIGTIVQVVGAVKASPVKNCEIIIVDDLGLTQKSRKSLIYRTAKTPRTPRVHRVCVSPMTVQQMVQ
jgi:cellulose synthase/poly-beta-1,6-N-acetylglucosamine synthase-like glycosyltransferase